MPVEGIDRNELEQLAKAGASVTVPAAIVLIMALRIEELETEAAQLRDKLADYQNNSRNSSKPPSSDRHNPNKPLARYSWVPEWLPKKNPLDSAKGYNRSGSPPYDSVGVLHYL